MTDKSPRHQKSLKSSKSIKQRRADKKLKAATDSAMEKIVPNKNG